MPNNVVSNYLRKQNQTWVSSQKPSIQGNEKCHQIHCDDTSVDFHEKQKIILFILRIYEFQYSQFHEEQLESQKKSRYTVNCKFCLTTKAQTDQKYDLDSITDSYCTKCKNGVSRATLPFAIDFIVEVENPIDLQTALNYKQNGQENVMITFSIWSKRFCFYIDIKLRVECEL